MNRIKALIADDEQPLRQFLRAKLAVLWPDLKICGEAENGQQALAMIKSEQPDVVFLDIKMPGLSGMEVARRASCLCRIVFITAYEAYAVEAFEREALDYLVKPVSDERLAQTVERLREELAAPEMPEANLEAVIEHVMVEMKKGFQHQFLKWLRVQEKESIRLIDVNDVYYFQASDKYTLVLTADEESLIKKPIKELAGELDPDRFWQIHRGTIVNVHCIEKVSFSLSGKLNIKLKELGAVLSASRSFAHLFKKM